MAEQASEKHTSCFLAGIAFRNRIQLVVVAPGMLNVERELLIRARARVLSSQS